MPIGIKQLSPHTYDSNIPPLCKNCDPNDTLESCCKNQQLKLFSKYKNMESPDYTFVFDELQRNIEKNNFYEKGMVP